MFGPVEQGTTIKVSGTFTSDDPTAPAITSVAVKAVRLDSRGALTNELTTLTATVTDNTFSALWTPSKAGVHLIRAVGSGADGVRAPAQGRINVVPSVMP